ncbi:response regulator [uncultured Methanoregula sp.]|uniref:response regulator n=1 Tax=uncultured Methanoregula sp. TaxID=1005933 RepID=UPI002AAAAEC3|nr:response regulator [uncultured Methanoregula sp.]
MIHILLVDDDRDILDIMRLDLEDVPAFAVDTCSASTEAVELIRQGNYDVIIADWRMPVLNGTELIKKIRSNGCKSLVILYSGHNVSSDIRTAIDSGADYYLHRGGDPETEFAQLREMIGKAGIIRDGKKPD